MVKMTREYFFPSSVLQQRVTEGSIFANTLFLFKCYTGKAFSTESFFPNKCTWPQCKTVTVDTGHGPAEFNPSHICGIQLAVHSVLYSPMLQSHAVSCSMSKSNPTFHSQLPVSHISGIPVQQTDTPIPNTVM